MRGNDGLEHVPTAFSIARKKAKKRDKHICQCCGKNHKELTVHHVYGKAKYPQYASEEMNLFTMCWACHEKYHKMFVGIDRVNLGTLTAYLNVYAKTYPEQTERIMQVIQVLFVRLESITFEIYGEYHQLSI